MNTLTTLITGACGFAALMLIWIATQFLARKMRTKNHLDNASESCGNCTCGGSEGACKQQEAGTSSGA